jgi:hypothetical protein
VLLLVFGIYLLAPSISLAHGVGLVVVVWWLGFILGDFLLFL